MQPSALKAAMRCALRSICIAPFALALLPAAALGAPTPAQLETARKLFAEAEKDQDAGHWEFALRKLQGVASIKETPGVRFHIGNCLENLGRLLAALESFQRAQSLAEDSRTKDVIDLVGPRIDQLRKRIPTLTVRVTGHAGEVSVLVDDKPLDNTLLGSPVGLDPGPHVVVVQFPGEAAIRRVVALADFRGESLEFTRAAASPAAPSSPPPRSLDLGPGGKGSTVPATAWVAFGAGVALGVGGWLSFRHAGSVADDSEAVCARSIACDPARVDAVRRYDALALGLWSAAAVSVGTGALITLTSSRSPSAPSVSLHPAGVSLRGAF